MIINYGYSIQGKSHIEKNTVCQDAHYIKVIKNGWIIAAVADGVGSAKNADVGAKLAVKSVVDFCDEYMPYDYNTISIKSMIRTAFNYALKRIIQEADKNQESIESYDTTLSLVIYDGQRIIYGHSGDGAIIGLTVFGDFIEITKPQKGIDGTSVIPLRGGYATWEIDTYDEDLASVLLVTDGMLETLCPYLLRDTETKTDKVYVPLGCFFADPLGFSDDTPKNEMAKKAIRDLLITDDSYNTDDFYARLLDIYEKRMSEHATSLVESFKLKNFPIYLVYNEKDDKTVVGFINTDISVDNKSPEHYSEPDWNALQEAWNRKAYPHLYEDNTEGNHVNSDATQTSDDQSHISIDKNSTTEDVGMPNQKTASSTQTLIAPPSNDVPPESQSKELPVESRDQSHQTNSSSASNKKKSFMSAFIKALKD